MRQYQPIWERIKVTKTATIVAPVENHRKIIQAVRKEKCKDYGWKQLCIEKGHKFNLTDTVKVKEGENQGSITFTLTDVSGISIDKL